MVVAERDPDRYKTPWIELFKNLKAIGNSAARYYDLKQMYGQDERRYHTWNHKSSAKVQRSAV